MNFAPMSLWLPECMLRGPHCDFAVTMPTDEAHNNGRYGLRIFTGRSPHNGEGMPGFYPKSALPCAPVSETNQFKVARFVRQYSWRNGKNRAAAPPTALFRPAQENKEQGN